MSKMTNAEICDKILTDPQSLPEKIRVLTAMYFRSNDTREQSMLVLTMEMLATKELMK